MNHGEQKRLFLKIKTELGPRFEREVLRFTQNDVERSYWSVVFLVGDASELIDSVDIGLIKRICRRAVSINTNPSSKDSKIMNQVAKQMTLKVFYSVILYKTGEVEEARRMKQGVERLLKDYSAYLGAFPALSDEEKRVYKQL